MKSLFVIGDFLFKEFVLEDQQVDNGYRDICVGKVEDCAEEVVARINKEAEPLRAAVPLEEREVEHIHNATHHKWSIAVAEVRYGCHG